MMRILVWGFTDNRAGTEAVISNVATALAEEMSFDFLTFGPIKSHPVAFTKGNRVFVLPNKRMSYVRYRLAMRSFFREHAAEYDAVWCNLNILNNIDVLRLGFEFDIPRLILHAHNAGNDGKLHQRALSRLNGGEVDRYVTDRWACSGEAGRYFFGERPFVVVPNAIDMKTYAFDESARQRIRQELGLGNRFVVGAVGRLSEQKNHALLLRVMSRLVHVRPDTVLVVVGDGELRGALEKEVSSLRIEDHVVFTGMRDDVAAALSAFDAYAMPSLFEGFGIALLEAQANGLPCVVSDAITNEAVVSKAVFKLSLESEMDWVAMLAALPEGRYDIEAQSASRYDLRGLRGLTHYDDVRFVLDSVIRFEQGGNYGSERLTAPHYKLLCKLGDKKSINAFEKANALHPLFFLGKLEAAFLGHDMETARKLLVEKTGWGQPCGTEKRHMSYTDWNLSGDIFPNGYWTYLEAVFEEQHDRESLLALYRRDVDNGRIGKETLEKLRRLAGNEWPQERDRIIEEAIASGRYSSTAEQLIREDGLAEAALRYCQAEAGRPGYGYGTYSQERILRFYRLVGEVYPDETHEMLMSLIEQKSVRASGRNVYREICGIVQRMQSLFGTDEARVVVDGLKQRYHRRRNLMEELDALESSW